MRYFTHFLPTWDNSKTLRTVTDEEIIKQYGPQYYKGLRTKFQRTDVADEMYNEEAVIDAWCFIHKAWEHPQ